MPPDEARAARVRHGPRPVARPPSVHIRQDASGEIGTVTRRGEEAVGARALPREVSGRDGERPDPGEAYMDRSEVRERMMTSGPTVLSDEELLVLVGAASLAGEAMARLAWMSAGELVKMGLAEGKAAAVVAAFELGRRGAWAPPQRGERCLDPRTVHELMRGLAHAPVEEFHVVLLDLCVALSYVE